MESTGPTEEAARSEHQFRERPTATMAVIEGGLPDDVTVPADWERFNQPEPGGTCCGRATFSTSDSPPEATRATRSWVAGRNSHG